jgi:hypothetical protein
VHHNNKADVGLAEAGAFQELLDMGWLVALPDQKGSSSSALGASASY